MKRTILSCACLLLLAGSSRAKDIPLDVQESIIKNYIAVTGRGDRTSVKAAQEEVFDGLERPLKCGTPAVLDFVLNRSLLDKGLLKKFSADTTLDRPVLTDSYPSLSGNFMIHYSTVGDSAVYQPTDDNGNGVPLYVVKTADIFDSVFYHDIFDLGYPAPPTDEFYASGGDAKFDVYLCNLGGSVFGYTFSDSVPVDGPGTSRGTAFIVLDNDFAEIPIYKNRPLDAVRVTAAHEYFHAIQFGIDTREAEDYAGALPQRYWMEMSATWMEEEHYDQINDYYYYLPIFFDQPNESLQAFRSFSDLHPYACVVYPLYLSERFNKDVIREIWLRCGRTVGPDFLLAAAEVIDSVSNGTASYASTFGEFAIWNYFTNANVRANLAPPGIGYSERANYPAIPDSMIAVIHSYPAFKAASPPNRLTPFHNAAYYMRLESLESIVYPESFWNCTRSSWANCSDSSEVPDPVADPYDFLAFDTSWWQCNTWIGLDCIDSTELPDESGSSFFHVDTSYWLCTGGTNVICVDSIEVVDTTLGYEFNFIDSSLRLYDCLDPSYRQPWGLGVVLQDAVEPDSVSVGRYVIPPPPEMAKQCDSIDLFHPRQYRSATFIFAPGSPFRENFSYVDPISFGYFVDETSDTATEYASLEPAVMIPYPNPAVISEMESDSIYFKFQLPTDSAGFRAIDTGYVLIDIFTIGGDKVRSLKVTKFDPVLSNPLRGEFIFGWDMKNAGGSPVASGAYLVYARLHAGILRTAAAPGGGTEAVVNPGVLLAEAKTKVAIIR